MKYNIKDYIRGFAFKMHPPFLIDHLFALGYSNTDLFFFTKGGWLYCYFSKETIKRTSKEGIKLYSDIKKFDDYIKEYDEYEKRATEFFESIIKKGNLTKDEAKKYMLLIIEWWEHFQKTEFLYLDSAYKYSLEDENTKINLERFGKFKFRAREYANLILYSGPKYFEKLVKIISGQLNLDYEVVSNCSYEQVLDLFDNKIPSKSDTESKKASQLYFRNKNKICWLDGEKSKDMIKTFLDGKEEENHELKGTAVSKGKAIGKVKLIITDSFEDFDGYLKKINDFKKGDIIVAETTTPEFTPAFKKASAIIAAQGGLMSHAAIVSREMVIPCIVGVYNATKILKDGDLVEVDANLGIVKILERAK
jgi:phosphoenolpyruvate synthase/pyruvate phosphate dikinase